LITENVRLYIFYLFIGALAIEYHIREDKPVKYGRKDGAGDQLSHFRACLNFAFDAENGQK